MGIVNFYPRVRIESQDGKVTGDDPWYQLFIHIDEEVQAETKIKI